MKLRNATVKVVQVGIQKAELPRWKAASVCGAAVNCLEAVAERNHEEITMLGIYLLAHIQAMIDIPKKSRKKTWILSKDRGCWSLTLFRVGKRRFGKELFLQHHMIRVRDLQI